MKAVGTDRIIYELQKVRNLMAEDFWSDIMPIYRTLVTLRFLDINKENLRMPKRICVIDGNGGGIGSTLIKYLKKAYGESMEIWALGTNAIATCQMIKAGANRGASGENAIAHSINEADLIIGPISVTWANAMLGEVTPCIAEAVMSSPAPKILIPLTQENVVFIGMIKEPLPHMVQSIVEDKIKEVLKNM